MRTRRLLAIALMLAMLLFSLQTAIGEDVTLDLPSEIEAPAEAYAELVAEEEEVSEDYDLEGEEIAFDEEASDEDEAPADEPVAEEAIEVAPEEDIVAVAEEEEEEPTFVEEIDEADESDLLAVLEDGEELTEITEEDAEEETFAEDSLVEDEPEVAEYTEEQLETLASVDVFDESGANEGVTVTEGDTLQLYTEAIAADGKVCSVQSFVWASDNENVASVSDTGVVTAYDVEEPTTVTITATPYLDGEDGEGNATKTAVTDKAGAITITVIPVTSAIDLAWHDTLEALTENEISLENDARVLDYVLQPEAYITGDNQMITAVSSDASVLKATVYFREGDHSILLTPVSTGAATLTLTSADKKVTRKLTVNCTQAIAPSAAAVKFPTKLQVVKGKTAVITPEGAYKSLALKYVSSNKKIATVTSKGVVKGIKAGTAKITITGSYTSTAGKKVTIKKTTVTVKVIAKATTKWKKALPKTANIIIGSKTTGSATLKGTLSAKIAASNKPVVVTTSNAKVATASVKVSGTAVTVTVLPVAAGTAKITAKTNDGTNKSTVCTVKVYNAPTDLMINGPETFYLNVSTKLTATAIGANGLKDAKAMPENVKWSLPENVEEEAVISETGELLIKNTTNPIKVRAIDGNNPKAECILTITPEMVEGVKPTAVTITGDDVANGAVKVSLDDATEPKTLALTAAVEPEGATQQVIWKSSNTNVADVDENGIVTVKAPGTANITASVAGNSSVSATVKLTATKTLTDIELDNVEVAAGKSVTLKPVLVPAGATAKLTYKSADTKIATVTAKGVVKGIKAGKSTKITVTAGTLKKTITVKVLAKAATKVAVKAPGKGNYIAPLAAEGAAPTDANSLQLSATVTPTAASKKVTWSSNNKNVIVDATGKVTANTTAEKLTATVTATAADGSGKKASVVIHIGTAPTSITVAAANSAVPGTLYVAQGKTTPVGAVVAQLTDKDGNPSTWQDVNWEILDSKGKANKAFATVNAKGQVKGIKPGTVYLRATSKDGTALKNNYKTMKVVVVAVAKATTKVAITGAEDFTFNGKTYMYEGQTGTLKATVTPAKKAGVVWTTSNKAVVSIQPDGTFKAESAGTATITATAADGAKNNKLTITVIPEATRIEVLGLHAVSVGAELQLKAQVYDKDDNLISDSPVNWVVDDTTKAKVNASGLVTGEDTGHVVVTATALAVPSGVTKPAATFDVEVTEKVVGGKLSIWQGGKDVTGWDISMNIHKKPVNSVQLIARVEPDSANPSVIWSSMDESVVKVDENGVVTPVGDGHTKVIARMADDPTNVEAKVNFLVDTTDPKAELRADANKNFIMLSATENSIDLFADLNPQFEDSLEFTWEIVEGSDIASFSPFSETTTTNTLVATEEGTVLVRVTNVDYPEHPAELAIDVVNEISADTLAFSVDSKDILMNGDEPVTSFNVAELLVNPLTDMQKKYVSWESNNDAVTVKDGVASFDPDFTGTATITAKLTGRDNVDISDSVTLNMYKQVKTITIAATEGWTLFTDKENTQHNQLELTVTVTPADATDPTVTLTSSDDNVATATWDDATKTYKVTFYKAANVTFTATANDDSGVTASYDVVLKETDSDFTWSIDSNGATATITGYTNATASSVTIPQYINGVLVKAIGNTTEDADADGAFQGKTNLQSVEIPNTIEVIGKKAFKDCTSLASMTTYPTEAANS